MKTKTIAATAQGANAANLTELAALMTAFAKANPAMIAEIAASIAPKGEKPAKQAKKQAFMTVKGINVTEGYTSKSGQNRSFLVYGEGTKEIKETLKGLGGRFNVFTLENGERVKGWNFRKEDREKVLTALK